ncbi:MAG: orotidine-5'-phosphate decarboxylase [Ekhidna sp.]|nr:orotidine-5'-phosphate decarboxylase [Ekhidna sp.]
MTRYQLFQKIKDKESFLCVGLDTDLQKIPKHLLKEEDPIFSFNKQIIDETHKYAVAYKPNTAFYESMGSKGWDALQKTLEYIPNDMFTIADAKRADIGNTSAMYARAFFEHMDFDSVTVAPYMGSDSIRPFLGFENKWVIILAATSNPGGLDFQHLSVNGEKLYEKVINTSKQWGSPDDTMYVVGATRPEALKEIRNIIPDHFLLIPGIGAQGGDLKTVCDNGLNSKCGLLVNSSRGIIYSDSTTDFAKEAGTAAKKIQLEMADILNTR